MHPLTNLARKLGALYLVFALGAIFNEFFFSAGFVVSGDPASTARNIMDSEFIYRAGLLFSFFQLIIFMILVTGLYKLFKDVDQAYPLIMALFVTLGVSLSLAGIALKSVPLIFLGGSDYFSSFTQSQLEVLSYSFLRIRFTVNLIASVFWGLWLFPFGLLAWKSGFIPKVFGFFLIVAGIGYLVSGTVSLLLPDQRQLISNIMMPLYFGEIPIIFWLLIKGARPNPALKDVASPSAGNYASTS